MRASVCLPTFRRRLSLMRTLRALDGQIGLAAPLQVIVVDDGSGDGTAEAVRAATFATFELVLVEKPNGGPSSARNVALRRAEHPIVLFVDDDVVPVPDWAQRHLAHHRDQSGTAVIGPLSNPSDMRFSSWVDYEQAQLQKSYRAIAEGLWQAGPRQFFTGNASAEREALLAVGGFNETLKRGEDVELAYRMARERGTRFVFDPAAIGWHYAERSYSSWLNTPYAYGRADGDLGRQGEDWLLPTIAQEFRERHALTRALVSACLGRPAFASGVTWMGGLAADLLYKVGLPPLSRAAYGAIFNLRYYQGLRDSLGSPDLLRGARQGPLSGAT